MLSSDVRGQRRRTYYRAVGIRRRRGRPDCRPARVARARRYTPDSLRTDSLHTDCASGRGRRRGARDRGRGRRTHRRPLGAGTYLVWQAVFGDQEVWPADVAGSCGPARDLNTPSEIVRVSAALSPREPGESRNRRSR